MVELKKKILFTKKSQGTTISGFLSLKDPSVKIAVRLVLFIYLLFKKKYNTEEWGGWYRKVCGVIREKKKVEHRVQFFS